MTKLSLATTRALIVTALAFAATSCSTYYDLFTSGCSDELRGAMEVDVVDSISAAPAAGGAKVVVTGTSFADSVTVPDTATTQVALLWFEDRIQGGYYSIAVTRADYRPWQADRVHISANRCHVTSFAHVTARMQR